MPKLNCIGSIFRKITVCMLGAKTWNVNFLETGYTSEMDLIVVWYSATNNCLLSNSQFHFQGILVVVCGVCTGSFTGINLNLSFPLVDGWMDTRQYAFSIFLLQLLHRLKRFSLAFVHWLFKFVPNVVIWWIFMWRIWCPFCGFQKFKCSVIQHFQRLVYWKYFYL